MNLYNGFSPNGARVQVFLAEKDIEIPTKLVNVPEGDTRQSDFLRLNSLGEIPVLELDDGTVLTESIAICRYLELLHPEPRLFGEDSLEQATIEMWNRRIELRIFNAIGDVGRHEFEFFKSRGQVPEYAKFRRADLRKNLAWLDDELSDGRSFIVGDKFSVADITGMAALFLMVFARYEIPMELGNVIKWADALKRRPSFPKFPASLSAEVT